VKLRLRQNLGKRPIGGWRVKTGGREFKTDSLNWRDLIKEIEKYCGSNDYPLPWDDNPVDWLSKALAYQHREFSQWVDGEEEQDDRLVADVRRWLVDQRSEVFQMASQIDADERAEVCRGCGWHVPEFEDGFSDRAAQALTRGKSSRVDCGACSAHGWHCGVAVWKEDCKASVEVRGCWA
jgi:hypothetical protein